MTRFRLSLLRPWLLTLVYLLGLHLLGLLGLSLFRGLKYVVLSGLQDAATPAPVWPAFVRGVWFDNVVGCYVLLLPLVVLLLAAACGWTGRAGRRAAGVWLTVCYGLLFLISAADIPYFAYFFKDIDSSIFEWMGYAGTTAGMVAGEVSYYAYALAFVLATSGYAWAAIGWRRHIDRQFARPASRPGWAPAVAGVALSAAAIGLCLFGIRGRTGYNPIKVSQAYYCGNAFLNQLGINPAFNLLTSTLDDRRKENRPLALMPDAEALSYMRRRLGAEGRDSLHPLRRTIEVGGPTCRPNVVVILMESMSAALLHCMGQPLPLTPTLDSLAGASLFFPNFYSAGTHTNIGMTATLYGMPAVLARNLMKGTVTPHRTGLPTVLKERGYTNLFFMTHEAQYDNMNAFFRTNGYDEIYAQENYPRSAVVNSFGVPDDFLFSYALPVLRRKAAAGRPFMATLLTISNHPPYVLPEGFRSCSRKPEQQIVEYADRSLGRFLSAARRERWFANTVFVVVADHGKIVGTPDAELPQSYNHVPLFIFGPGIPTGRYEGLGTQVDITPTLLGFLGGRYTTDGFGIDLMRHRRQCVAYASDRLLAARDERRCYLYDPATRQSFYYAVGPDGRLAPTHGGPAFDALRQEALAVAQAADCLDRRRR